MSNYIMIDNKKINISEETVKELKEKLGLGGVVEEMEELLLRDSGGFYEYMNEHNAMKKIVKKEGDVLWVYVPDSNTKWFFKGVDAIKAFCSKDPNNRWPEGTMLKTNYLAVKCYK